MPTTFWNTKHALTKGIICENDCDTDGKYVKRGRFNQPDYLFLALGKEAFKTEAEAKARGVELVNAKLASLAREEDKLKDLLEEWSVPPAKANLPPPVKGGRSVTGPPTKSKKKA